jgi:hypothetical protein
MASGEASDILISYFHSDGDGAVVRGGRGGG